MLYGSVVKDLPASVGDVRDASLIPGSGRSPGEGNDKPLQYCCLGNPMNRGAWWTSPRGLRESAMIEWISRSSHHIEASDGHAWGEKRLGRNRKSWSRLLRKPWNQLGEAWERTRGSMVLHQSPLPSQWNTRKCTRCCLSEPGAFYVNLLFSVTSSGELKAQWESDTWTWRVVTPGEGTRNKKKH